MSPLAHFPGGRYMFSGNTDYIYNPVVLCFNNKECDSLLKVGPFPGAHHYHSVKLTFKEDDTMRTELLKESPKEIWFEFYTSKGYIIRKIMMYRCSYEELDNYEVEIFYDDFQDFYF